MHGAGDHFGPAHGLAEVPGWFAPVVLHNVAILCVLLRTAASRHVWSLPTSQTLSPGEGLSFPAKMVNGRWAIFRRSPHPKVKAKACTPGSRNWMVKV